MRADKKQARGNKKVLVCVKWGNTNIKNYEKKIIIDFKF